MSGHSKWAKVHRQKGVTDAKKGNVFTKLGNTITIAAKLGGGDPEMNFKLKLAIEKAKGANMPKDNIDRAIKRGTGSIEGQTIEEVIYEAHGPAGITCIIESLTDNRNRTTNELKHIFSDHGFSLGAPGSVIWQYENKGVIGIKTMNDELELELIDQGASDIEKYEDINSVYCKPQDLEKLKKLLESKNIAIEFAEMEFVAKNKTTLDDSSAKEKFEKFVSTLEESDEVNNYYTNII
ncbi:MAG: Transcriptional regulator [Parcubacteria group bacterium GW2011_GWA2_38_13]|nr:MAG: Transcriptional regulator [Parcubacteria group bacterium GW2011_GWA2_38_13]